MTTATQSSAATTFIDIGEFTIVTGSAKFRKLIERYDASRSPPHPLTPTLSPEGRGSRICFPKTERHNEYASPYPILRRS